MGSSKGILVSILVKLLNRILSENVKRAQLYLYGISMLSNFTKFSKTLASTPLPPQLHPELHRGIDPVGSFPSSDGWPTALTTT